MSKNKNKRGAGRNKARRKKQEYKEHCRVMRTGGYVTDSNGKWTQNYQSLRISEASFRGTTAK